MGGCAGRRMQKALAINPGVRATGPHARRWRNRPHSAVCRARGVHLGSRCRAGCPVVALFLSHEVLPAALLLQLRCLAALAMLAAAPGALGFTVPVGSLSSPVKTLHSRFDLGCELLRWAKARPHWHDRAGGCHLCLRGRSVELRQRWALACA